MGSLILVLLLLVATPRLVVAYDFKTHRRISTEAAALSVLSSSCSPAPCRTPLMNLTKTLGGPGAQLPTDIGRTLADAAVAEDDDKRPANHFFNPLTGEGFTHLLGGQPAPLWALGAIVDNHGDVVVDESADIFEEPRLSFRSARSGLYEALTSPAAVSRRKSALTMVRLLGHVIHVLQDMAQPQHVRDDNHFALPFLPPHSPFRFEHPSAYEHWVEDNLDNIASQLDNRDAREDRSRFLTQESGTPGRRSTTSARRAESSRFTDRAQHRSFGGSTFAAAKAWTPLRSPSSTSTGVGFPS